MSSSRSISRDIKQILYGSAVVAGLGSAGFAHAQTAPVVEEVVVTGIRYSLQQSIETKRNAVGVVDVITAEDVGKFPDKNLAEALQRVPGVTVNREFGEGERVNIRGTDSSLTKTLLNGHSLVDRRLVHSRPAQYDAQLQLPDAARGHHRPDRSSTRPRRRISKKAASAARSTSRHAIRSTSSP